MTIVASPAESVRASTTAWQEASTGAEAISAGLDAARRASRDEVDRLAFAERIVISGAGSSLYIAQMGAAAMRAYCRLPAEAVPLSEVLLRPREVFARDDLLNQPVVAVSHSGATTEALEVVRAAHARDQHTLAGVVCQA